MREVSSLKPAEYELDYLFKFRKAFKTLNIEVQTQLWDLLLELERCIFNQKDAKKEVQMLISSAILNGSKLNPKSYTFNILFTGYPGIRIEKGAEIVTKIFQAVGLSPKGNIRIISRQDIIGTHVGETETKFKQIVDEVEPGCIIIVDIPEIVKPDNTRDYGNVVLPQLLQEITDSNRNVCFMFTGEKNKLETFLTVNDGLKSRISHNINFKLYKLHELVEITYCHLKEKYHYESKTIFKKYLGQLIDKIQYIPTFKNIDSLHRIAHQLVLIYREYLKENYISIKNLSFKYFGAIEDEDFLVYAFSNYFLNENYYVESGCPLADLDPWWFKRDFK